MGDPAKHLLGLNRAGQSCDCHNLNRLASRQIKRLAAFQKHTAVNPRANRVCGGYPMRSRFQTKTKGLSSLDHLSGRKTQ